ncbi:hypothetical protein IFM47457_06572 [Aspergillus lentulus]|nr:hypothetical protein IFM47457_06572 [Aspergillus lentulus]
MIPRHILADRPLIICRTSYLNEPITACSVAGIGSALEEEFHTKGLHVYATARSRTKMSHLENLPNGTILELDVMSKECITATVETI